MDVLQSKTKISCTFLNATCKQGDENCSVVEIKILKLLAMSFKTSCFIIHLTAYTSSTVN